MTDKLLLTVCLGCLGALVGLGICMRMKRRAEYFGDLDDFLRAFSESLSFTRDTVPELMRGYVARSPLLGEQLAECAAAMKSGRKAEISGGSLTKEEKRLVAETLASLGSRPPDAEKGAVEECRRKLGVCGKRAADTYARSGKAAVKLGLLAGLLAAVLCW
ncbi:MAG TPA: hypothetical protein H9892_01860 [Candidatus Protoclostridium stercorigallinarum]|uniref:Stage III sporulation protein AB n=1 Tax=Candidatus Protoclostridium stercorigallinarum TaxID=2838741 RepID=A0A9D1PZR2_9FIRM|nr:hypothetical protein [Candidatus Protoclostridium stercorigallinarum]